MLLQPTSSTGVALVQLATRATRSARPNIEKEAESAGCASSGAGSGPGLVGKETLPPPPRGADITPPRLLSWPALPERGVRPPAPEEPGRRESYGGW